MEWGGERERQRERERERQKTEVEEIKDSRERMG